MKLDLKRTVTWVFKGLKDFIFILGHNLLSHHLVGKHFSTDRVDKEVYNTILYLKHQTLEAEELINMQLFASKRVSVLGFIVGKNPGVKLDVRWQTELSMIYNVHVDTIYVA